MINSGATLVRGMRKLFQGLHLVERYGSDSAVDTNDCVSYLTVLVEHF